MQTNISEKFRAQKHIEEAENILRACVHCGFCTATCPTYQLLGDELDSPRGRIYLIKQMLEGQEVSEKTQSHLDRCLTCRSCETTCPSGVRYGRLVEIGREVVDQQVSRSFRDSLQRTLLRKVAPYPSRFVPLAKLALAFRSFLPEDLKNQVPHIPSVVPVEISSHERKMLVLGGCVQSAVTPQTNQSAARVLDALGVELINAPKAGCCGSVSHHMSAAEEGLAFMRRNIDAWWPYIEQGAEAIVISASGCGATVKEYGELLADDDRYREKAQRVSELAKDVGEVLMGEDFSRFKGRVAGRRIAFQNPCTLQHGQKLPGLVEKILGEVGFELCEVEDAHLCCGSAGTYSILQRDLSQRLLKNKLENLEQGKPELIATANVGCQMHMSTAAGVPVRHWIELIAELV